MSGVHIAVQRFVKRIGQSQVPSKPGLRSRIGKGKMQPDEFTRQAGTRRAQKLNRLLRSDRPCWLVRNKMVAPDGHMLVGSGSRMNILRHCLSSHQISDQFVSHRYEAPKEKELKPPGSLKSIVSIKSMGSNKVLCWLRQLVRPSAAPCTLCREAAGAKRMGKDSPAPWARVDPNRTGTLRARKTLTVQPA